MAALQLLNNELEAFDLGLPLDKIGHRRVVDLFLQRSVPGHIRSDYGFEFAATGAVQLLSGKFAIVEKVARSWGLCRADRCLG